MTRRVSGGLLALALLSVAGSAQAGGLDTPVLYSARHQGVGGAAVGYVDDASAVFHNPAGLTGIQGLGFTANLSPLFATLTASPGDTGELADAEGFYPTREAEPIVGPAFLLAAGYRLSDFLVVGLAAFPLASASAEYKSSTLDFNQPLCPDAGQPGAPRCTEFAKKPFTDRAQLVFIEVSPLNLALDLPLGLSVGVGYRVTLAQFEREKGDAGVLQQADVALSGVDYGGIRLGAQWGLGDWLSLGLAYRHKISPKLEADDGSVAGRDVANVATTFVVPARLSAGGRASLGSLAVAVDAHYGFNDQMQGLLIQGVEPSGDVAELRIPFRWKNSITLQGGLEYELFDGLPLRVGYAYDGEVASKHVPSAFGTPPAVSHSFTGGAGFVVDCWQLNVAGAYRTADVEVTSADVEGNLCETLCGKAGREYSLSLVGFYVDFSMDLDVGPLF